MNGVRKNPDGTIDKLVNGKWVRQGVAGKPTVVKPGKTAITPPGGAITNQTGVTNAGYAGAGAANNAFLASLDEIGRGSTAARDSTYGFLTKDLEAQKAQDLEAEKQMLAEIGIPVDYSQNPNAPTLYQKSINNVNKNYENQYATAGQTALTTGNQFFNDSVSRATALGGLSGSFLDTLTQADLAKLGLDQQKVLALKQLEVERLKASKMGGGGGGSSDSGGDIFLT